MKWVNKISILLHCKVVKKNLDLKEYISVSYRQVFAFLRINFLPFSFMLFMLVQHQAYQKFHLNRDCRLRGQALSHRISLKLSKNYSY